MIFKATELHPPNCSLNAGQCQSVCEEIEVVSAPSTGHTGVTQSEAKGPVSAARWNIRGINIPTGSNKETRAKNVSLDELMSVLSLHDLSSMPVEELS